MSPSFIAFINSTPFFTNNFTFFLRRDQYFSIGFKSGEYGGKYISWQLTASINSLILKDLWNVALSIITTCPGLSEGQSIFSTYDKNSFVLQGPVNTCVAFIPSNEELAIILVRASLLPETLISFSFPLWT